jgi:hypothetical protein
VLTAIVFFSVMLKGGPKNYDMQAILSDRQKGKAIVPEHITKRLSP